MSDLQGELFQAIFEKKCSDENDGIAEAISICIWVVATYISSDEYIHYRGTEKELTILTCLHFGLEIDTLLVKLCD